jgi:hypothetical protein
MLGVLAPPDTIGQVIGIAAYGCHRGSRPARLPGLPGLATMNG